MSTPLKDFRTSVDDYVDQWLEIESRATKKDKAAIGREILRIWAREKLHAHKIATKLLQANGMQPELFGDEPEDDGIPRKK